MFTGTIRHYLYYALQNWWLISFVNIWWITVFPTKGRLLFQNRKKIYIIESALAWGTPLIGVMVVVNGVSYSQGLTTPYVCYTASVPLFYFLLFLPDQLYIASCSTLLISICYSLAKKVK
jgi:hypothetical protein